MHASRRALNLIKYLLLMLSFMCFVIEIIQIVVGAVLHHLFSTYTVFIDNDFVRATHFLIAVGIVLVFLTIFGLTGMIFENVTMIFLYAGFFALVVILEIMLAVTAFSMVNRVDSMLYRRMRIVLERFHTDSFMRASFNHLQRQMNCCGVNSYEDWSVAHPNYAMPSSCCSGLGSWENAQENCVPRERGCMDPMSDFIGSRVQMIATGTTVIIVFQVICIITAIIMGVRLGLYKRQQRLLEGSALRAVQQPEPIMTEKPKF
ncbi:leukocyte surface antigen CD53-like [Anopheles aquasalis]|uniref:leukocyte surface antigen CD53-like n=1 Tax=Anopheles aquasalis TaxID=42839 RepID=UPI00215B1808|nr:leukocyte surface antigen CD53-like [Anopheles aquasalis]